MTHPYDPYVTSPDQAARDEGSRALTAAVLRMAAVTGTPTVERRPFGADSLLTATEAEPAAGIRFAVMLRNGAARLTRDYITAARTAGLDWATIGDALGLQHEAEERGDWVGNLAFDYAAGPQYRSDPVTFSFRCGTCGERVTDRGPECGHPADQEQGHAPGCERLAAASHAYEAQWEGM